MLGMQRKLGIGGISLRAALGAALGAALLLGATSAQATDDKATAATQAGRQAALRWLAFVDHEKYGTSWEEAAALFRASVGREAWVSGLRENRQPLGAVLSRTLQAEDYSTTLPGAPAGQYVTLRFGTVFEPGGSRIETLVLAPVAGTWRVLGYHATGSLSEEQIAADREAARGVALRWLAVEDRGSYGEAWDGAAASAQKGVPRARWVRSMEQARAPLGAVQSRVFKSAEYSTSVPGAPPGEYVTVLYDTAFETRASSGAVTETVTLRREGREWRVAGYLFP